jgi:hypothetical protein
MAPIPGYWGSFHVAYKEALRIFGYSSAVATSCAIIAHGTQYIFITILGLLCLRHEKISFGELKSKEKEVEEHYEQEHQNDENFRKGADERCKN